MVDGVVLVVDRKTPRTLVQRAGSQLEASGARVYGTVLNGADPTHPSYASYFRDYEI
jgi:Mrp family chromosome partitioning ATPase